MITVSCPLRISLVGGSTDHPRFLEKYKRGSVISFPCDLKVFVTIHRDKFGINCLKNQYIINYSKQESVKKISNIKNNLVRNCLEYFDIDAINCFLTSDIFSVGTGLASSSAYSLALIKSISIYKNITLNDFEICDLAQRLEKKFNPFVGQQDFYGSLKGLKRINFYENKFPDIGYLSDNIFNKMGYLLLYTGIRRTSSKILETIDIDKSFEMLNDVDELESAILKNDIDQFNHIIKKTWMRKKTISDFICQHKVVSNLDKKLSTDKRVLSHKLCGAGNGGYFLIFCEKNKTEELKSDYNHIKQISISQTGINHEILL